VGKWALLVVAFSFVSFSFGHQKKMKTVAKNLKIYLNHLILRFASYQNELQKTLY